MTIVEATIGQPYRVTGLLTDDEELDGFLFTLGCYSGEPIVLVSVVGASYVVSIRDGRYNIDQNLAQAIEIE